MIISTEAIAGPLPNHMSTEIHRDLETFTLEIFICKALSPMLTSGYHYLKKFLTVAYEKLQIVSML